jgi:FMN-dependent NADH-azoreductase
MTLNVLRIESSIKPQGAVSTKLMDEIIEKLGDTTVTTRNVSTTPAIDANWLGAVFAPSDARDDAQQEIAAYSDSLINEIQTNEVLVIGVPVYNFNIPARLKNWIDQIARAGVTFQYTETGPQGLIQGKRAILAFSSDGTAAGSDIDFAERYMRHILGFIGITDVTSVTAQQIAFDADAAWDAARKQIAELAA